MRPWQPPLLTCAQPLALLPATGLECVERAWQSPALCSETGQGQGFGALREDGGMVGAPLRRVTAGKAASRNPCRCPSHKELRAWGPSYPGG